MAGRTLISFDWAMKKMLRHKANFDILEGFLSVLLDRDIKINSVLESASNKNDVEEKFNIVDLLAQDETGSLFIIEIQYSREVDYFHRMIYSTSKSSIEHMKEGFKYQEIRKVFSINLLYFELGQGKDYVYHGSTSFKGIHENDILGLTVTQKNKFLTNQIFEIFPEYYIIQINKFNDVAMNSLDQWIYFFKNTEIPDDFTAKGLDKAKQKMALTRMTEAEKRAYESFMIQRNSERNIIATAKEEGLEEGLEKGLEKGREEGREEGREDEKRKLACGMLKKGMDVSLISELTGLSESEIKVLDC